MLRREFKLKDSEEIKVVLKQGRKIRSDYLTLFSSANTVGHCRAAVVVSRKVATGAVGRNRVRRVIFHQLRDRFATWGDQTASDMVVMVMNIPNDESLLKADLTKCFGK